METQKFALSRHGGRLGVAVNNAGTEGKPGPVIDLSAENYAAMFRYQRSLLGLKYELRIMQAQGSGSIVNITSTMGECGAANFSLYAGSKHAVESITKSVAIEAAGYGVRVNAVAPGPTDTAMLDRGEFELGTPIRISSTRSLGRINWLPQCCSALALRCLSKKILRHSACHSA
jgi:NAD(P)-dependent dehydrogenase (short-subunit alcohol dehydrogenase family)